MEERDLLLDEQCWVKQEECGDGSLETNFKATDISRLVTGPIENDFLRQDSLYRLRAFYAGEFHVEALELH